MSDSISRKDLSNLDIALFALYKLGGTSKKVHTEEIAWEAYQLAKERFSWRLPEFRKRGFPDKTPVRFALEQAKKKQNGRLVVGRAGGDINRPELEGWRFTPEGADWIGRNQNRILEALKQEAPDLPKLISEHFVKKLRTEPAFLAFKKNGNLDNVSSYMLLDMLACAPDSSKDIVKHKFERLLTTAHSVKDEDILEFLRACTVKFADLLNGLSKGGTP